MDTTVQPELLNIIFCPPTDRIKKFCIDFIHSGQPRYVFGCNEYAVSIAKAININGFIDDVTKNTSFCDRPIVKIGEVPKNALVVSVVLGRPFVAENRLRSAGLEFLDYFAFAHNAALALKPVKFWDQFKQDLENNYKKYEWIYGLLEDFESKQIFKRIVNFRISHSLEFMRGFADIQYRQYFENFLHLQAEGEVFADVGAFDGYTSAEFIKHCPNFKQIHVFEPEPTNMVTVKKRLENVHNVTYHLYGLYNANQILKFQSSGSTSMVCDQGHLEINVIKLDDLDLPITFLKMDIEGGEKTALEGARTTIEKHHPRLAISVYHQFDDFWHIPEQILSYRDDYRLFLRHYTEGVDETVMFFI